MLKKVQPKSGNVFDGTNLLKAWRKAVAATGIEGLILHDLRRSAARNLGKAGVSEGLTMKIGDWKTRAVFDRCNIVDENGCARSNAETAGL
jgi:hypothetical protein